MAALLFKVEAAVKLKITEATCTSLPCQWNNNYVEKIVCEPISGITFYKKETKDSVKPTYPTTYPVPLLSQKEDFLHSIRAAARPPVALSMFTDHCEP